MVCIVDTNFLTVDEIINNRQQDIIISQLFIGKLKAFNNNNNNSKGSEEEEKSLNFKKAGSKK